MSSSGFRFGTASSPPAPLTSLYPVLEASAVECTRFGTFGTTPSSPPAPSTSLYRVLEASGAERSSTAPTASSPHMNHYLSSVQLKLPLAPPTRTGYSTGAIEPVEEDEETRVFSTGTEQRMLLDNTSDDGDASDDGDVDNGDGDIITTSGT